MNKKVCKGSWNCAQQGQDKLFKIIFEGMYKSNGDLSHHLLAFRLFLGLETSVWGIWKTRKQLAGTSEMQLSTFETGA